jgi:hypothetical protein
MPGRRLILSLIFVAAIGGGAGWAAPRALGQAESKKPSQATGKIVGIIKSKGGLGFSVVLSAAGVDKPIGHQEIDYIEEGGKFAFDDLDPAVYKLEISSMPGLGCGILPWSQMVTVYSGKTVHVIAKIKHARNAICE